MKKFGLLTVFLTLISCQSDVKSEDIQKLNGYWGIQQVGLPNGEKKEYKVNETIDYFELKGTAGFRQKVMPQFDGKFKTNGISEAVKIIKKDDLFYIEYNTSYGKWKEQILSIEDSILILKNQEKIEYIYKRFKPFSFK